jgi:acetyl esterase/lipase
MSSNGRTVSVLADLRGLPPLLIYAEEYELLRAEAIRFAEKATAAGVEATLKVWAGMIHAFPLFAGFVPEGKVAIAEAGTFLHDSLQNRRGGI